MHLQEHYLIDSSTSNLGERVSAVIDYLELNFRGESIRSANPIVNSNFPPGYPGMKLMTYLSDKNLISEPKDSAADVQKYGTVKIPVSPTSHSKNLPIIRETREPNDLETRPPELFSRELTQKFGSNLVISKADSQQVSAEQHSPAKEAHSFAQGIIQQISLANRAAADKPRNLQAIPNSREELLSLAKESRRSQQTRDLLNSAHKQKDPNNSNPYGFPVKEFSSDAVYYDSLVYGRDHMVSRPGFGMSAEKNHLHLSDADTGLKGSGNLAIIDFEEQPHEPVVANPRRQSTSITIHPQMIIANCAPISPVEKLTLRSRLDERLVRGEYREKNSLVIPSRDQSREHRTAFPVARLPSPTSQNPPKLERGSSISYAHRDSALNSAVKDSLQAISAYLVSENASPKASQEKDSTVDKIIESQPLAKLSFSEPLSHHLQRTGIQYHPRDLGSQRNTHKQSVVVSNASVTGGNQSAQGSARTQNVPNLKLGGISATKQDGLGQKETSNNLEHLISYRKKQDSTREPKRDVQRDRTASERIRDRKSGTETQGVIATSTQIQPRRPNPLSRQFKDDNIYADDAAEGKILQRIDSKEENEVSSGDVSDGSHTQLISAYHLHQYGLRPDSKHSLNAFMSSLHPHRRESRDLKTGNWRIPPGVELHSQLALRGNRGSNQPSYLGAGAQLHQHIHKVTRDIKPRQPQAFGAQESGRDLPGHRYYDHKDSKPIYSDIYQSHKQRGTGSGLVPEFNLSNHTHFGVGSKKMGLSGLNPPAHFAGVTGGAPKSQYDSLLRSGAAIPKDLLGGQLTKHLNMGGRKTAEITSKHGRNSSNHYDTSRQAHFGQIGLDRKRDFVVPTKPMSQLTDEAALRKQYLSSANSTKPAGRF